MKPPVHWLTALALVLLLAAGLRAINLGGRTLWYDEAFSVLFAEKGLNAMLAGTIAAEGGEAAEEHPLLYYVGLDVWMQLAGQSPAMVRVFSLFAGVLTVAVVYRLAADLLGVRAGLVSALLAAASPFHVQYAQETRMYALMALWLLLATWCFARAIKAKGAAPRKEAVWWLAFALFAALSMYTQQLAAFYLIALALFPVMLRRWDVVVRIAVSSAVALMLYLPWLRQLPGQISKLQGAFWLERPTLTQILQTLFAYTVPLLDLPRWIIVGGLLVTLLLIAFLALPVQRRRRAGGWRLGLAVWLAFVPPALMYAAGQFVPVYLLRALLPCALMFSIAAGWLVTRGGLPRAIALALMALWIVVGGAGLLQHYRWDTFPNAPFDRAAAYLSAQVQPGDAIVHSNKGSFLPMTYYDRDLLQAFVADPPGAPQDTLAPATQHVLGVAESPCASAAAGGAARVWFVILQREIKEAGDGEGTSLGWMLRHYQADGVTTFNDLEVYRFAEPDAAARQRECPP